VKKVLKNNEKIRSQMSKLRAIFLISLLLAMFSNQNISANSQDVPKVPAVISQTEFDYQGTHFVVQLIPSSDAVIRQELYNGGGLNAGDYVLTSTCSIVLLRGSDILSHLEGVPGRQFVLDQSNSKWLGNGEAPIFLLSRKDKLPLIIFPQYGTSNGSDYRVYIIQKIKDKFEINQVEFSVKCYGDHQGALFGSEIKTFYDETNHVDYLRIYGYDNSIGNNFTIYYMADYHDEALWKLVEYRTGSAPTKRLEAER